MGQEETGSLARYQRQFAEPQFVPITAARNVTPAEYGTVSGLFRVFRRRWPIMVAVACVIFAIGTFICLALQPRYSATTIVEINNDDQSDTASSRSGGSSQTPDQLKAEVQTDISILQSDGLALAVIKQLRLVDKEPFRQALDLREKELPLDQAPISRERLIKLFQRNLKVETPADTRLINISFQNPNPVVASDVANSLADKFIQDTLGRRHRSTSQPSFWLQKELDDLKVQVEQSEQNLAEYERKTGLSGVDLTGGASGDGTSGISVTAHNTVTERLFALNQELTAAEARRISAETVYNLVHSQDPDAVLGLGTVTALSGSGSGGQSQDAGLELLRSLRAQDTALTREYADTAASAGAGSPRLIQLQTQMDAIQQQMQVELKRIRARAESSYEYAKENEETIRRQFIRQQSVANVMADASVQLHVLAQEAYSSRSLYESLFSKLQTASLASGVRATRIDIVEKAMPAGLPSSPEYGKYLALVAGFGIFCGVSSAFLHESLDETVRTSRDLDESNNFPVLGYVPRLQGPALLHAGSGDSELVNAPLSPFSEAFRSLRTSILMATRSTQSRTVLVTSALGDAGKTLVAYNLGVAFAQAGARVLLIDGDLRHPELHRLFGVEVSPGLSDLRGHISDRHVSGVVQHELLSTLFLLPAGIQPRLPAEFFDSETFDSLLHAAAAHYDYVIIDSPPILPVTDASIIATKVTGVIGVLRSQNTTRPAFYSFVKALERTNTPILGFVLNDVRHPTLDGFQEYSYSR